jgi:tape measure domain-containing protein
LSFDPLLVEIKATDSGFTAAIVKAQGQIKRFETETNQSVASVSNVLGRLRTQVLAFVSVWGAFRLGKGLVDAGVQMQQLTAKMGAATGNAEIAAASLKFVRQEAERLGLDFRSTADGFASFAASALRSGLTFEETKNIFTGVSEAATGMRLSAERTSLVFVALSQMASKGTVSMEELKQQLGESLPGAMQVFAKAMGKGNAEFIKMIENGQVTTRDLIKLGDGLRKDFGGAAEEASKGAQAAFNRFGNALFELQTKVANNGFLDSVTKSVRDLTTQLNDPATIEGLKAFAEYLGDIVSVAAKAASAIGNTLTHFRDRQLAFKELRAEGKFFVSEDQIQDKVQTIQLRRQVLNAPYTPSTPPPSVDPNYTLGKSSAPAVSAAAQKAADMREQLRNRVQSMNAGLITEDDPNKVNSAQAMASLNKRYEEEQDLLDKALKKKAITDEEFKENSLKVELDYQARMAEIRKQYRDELLSDEQAFAEGFLGIELTLQDKSLTEQGRGFRDSIQQAAQHNRTFFQLEKAAALARALLAARQSVVDAYRFGTSLGGPVLGAAFAGVAAAAQAANIAAIASTSFGGGGGVSSSGGGGGGGISSDASSAGSQKPDIGAKSIYINLQGDDQEIWSKNSVRKLIEKINDAVGDGTRIAFA